MGTVLHFRTIRSLTRVLETFEEESGGIGSVWERERSLHGQYTGYNTRALCHSRCCSLTRGEGRVLDAPSPDEKPTSRSNGWVDG
jgi:hypothetical protein